MRILHLIGALTLASSLAACGDDQTAQNAPAPSTPPANQQTTAPATPPAPPTRTTEAPPATSPLPPPAGNPLPSPLGSPAQPPGSSQTATPGGTAGAASDPQTTASIGAAGSGAEAFRAAVGRSFSGGPVTLRLGADQRFTMRDEGGRTVTGRYAQNDGVVTFTNPEGDTAGARFPLRCRFEPQANGAFRLADIDGACPHFGNVTFRPEG